MTSFPLSRTMLGDGQREVASFRSQSLLVSDLQQRAGAWYSVLEEEEGTRWAVYHSNPFEFISILFALWQLERTACVPGDNCHGTVERLVSTVDGFVGEFEHPRTVSDSDSKCSRTVFWSRLNTDYCALELYTSGSTGQPKAISKTIKQLEAEAAVLEEMWPRAQAAVVLATVSHQHLYGMTFRLFWPISTGRVFECELCEYSEDIVRQASAIDLFTLISSPSHLGRLNDGLDWESVGGKCVSAYSSAAPLMKEDSLQASNLLNAAIMEIYGSSETGAIAWRVQNREQEDALWLPLPKVQLSTEEGGALMVVSPYSDSGEPFTLADQVKFSGEAFQLLGRMDRIAKVEGKRVSLVAIEQCLHQSNLVKVAKALTISRKRVETVVVAELTDEGKLLLGDKGRRHLVSSLKRWLAPNFEAVVVPRRWRFVDQLPYNKQGKLPLGVLQRMFEKDAVRWPDIIAESVTDNRVEIDCEVPAALEYFDGHFANNPILPGVVQVHWAEAYGRRVLKIKDTFLRLEVIKFQQVILPSDRVTITLEYDEDKKKLKFQYESRRGVHSSGRICFG
ncbi:AMP-binding protein [Pontibacterium sp.]|uniref:ApeI family dehydratase n=1 Tax=Pontibacterium sp. TaxID=2036026 RepID=UPI003512E1D2